MYAYISSDKLNIQDLSLSCQGNIREKIFAIYFN